LINILPQRGIAMPDRTGALIEQRAACLSACRPSDAPLSKKPRKNQHLNA
jgi:hypothetical protein